MHDGFLKATLAYFPSSRASLKDKPPEGLKLDGTEWQLDPYNSDDGGEAIDRAARKAAEPSSSRAEGGGIFGRDDPIGRREVLEMIALAALVFRKSTGL